MAVSVVIIAAMGSLYLEDLAYIQAAAFGGLAQGAVPEILRLLNSAAIQIRRIVDVGCGAGPLSAGLVRAGFEATGIDNSTELLAIGRRTQRPKQRVGQRGHADALIRVLARESLVSTAGRCKG